MFAPIPSRNKIRRLGFGVHRKALFAFRCTIQNTPMHEPYFRIFYSTSHSFPGLVSPLSSFLPFCPFRHNFSQTDMISQIVLAQEKKLRKTFLTTSVLVLLKTPFQYSRAS